MKNIIKICLLLIVSNSFSQSSIRPIEELLTTDRETNQNTYFKDINNKLQNCVGNWIYDNGSDYFKINITKKKLVFSEKYNVYIDALIIKYEYKKDGVCKYYNLNSITIPSGANAQPSDLKSSFVVNNDICFVYHEPYFTGCYRRKTGRLEIQLVSGSTNQLQWTRVTDTHYFNNIFCDDGTPPDNSEFLIPANMILTKIP